jgi:lamin tail-like protein
MRKLAVLMVTALGFVMMSASATWAESSPQAARSPVVIHEIFYNSPGPDNGSNASLNAEWVQLHNRSGHRVTLTHWTVRDAVGHVYTFGRYVLKAHEFVKVHTGRGTNTHANRFWGRRAYIWNNDGDTATLKTAQGVRKSRCSYSDSSESHAFKIC